MCMLTEPVSRLTRIDESNATPGSGESDGGGRTRKTTSEYGDIHVHAQKHPFYTINFNCSCR